MAKDSPPRGFWQRNRATIQAVAIFCVSLIVFFWLLNNSWVLRTVLDPFTGVVARVTVWLFLLAGQEASAIGRSVTINSVTLSIATGCNGVEAMALYFAGVLALPVRWTRRLIGLGIGLVGIFIINQVRVISLFLVAMYRPDFLPQAHNYAGQTFVIVMGMALWFFWAEQYADFRPAKGAASTR